MKILELSRLLRNEANISLSCRKITQKVADRARTGAASRMQRMALNDLSILIDRAMWCICIERSGIKEGIKAQHNSIGIRGQINWNIIRGRRNSILINCNRSPFVDINHLGRAAVTSIPLDLVLANIAASDEADTSRYINHRIRAD